MSNVIRLCECCDKDISSSPPHFRFCQSCFGSFFSEEESSNSSDNDAITGELNATISHLRGDIYLLREHAKGWNMDGSSSHKPDPRYGSWISFWEEETEQQSGLCSFSGCRNEANVGGHIWLQGIKKAFIAPICSDCNDISNEKRMQGSGSLIKRGTCLVNVEYTSDMRYADRRFANNDEEDSSEESDDDSSCGRGMTTMRCVSCRKDISDRPDSHTQCFACYSSGAAPHPTCSSKSRRCSSCRRDISDRPDSHTHCFACYSAGELPPFRRLCSSCRRDISDRPSNHTLCHGCYLGGEELRKRKRRCQSCRRDISDRPSHHALCYECYCDESDY